MMKMDYHPHHGIAGIVRLLLVAAVMAPNLEESTAELNFSQTAFHHNEFDPTAARPFAVPLDETVRVVNLDAKVVTAETSDFNRLYMTAGLVGIIFFLVNLLWREDVKDNKQFSWNRNLLQNFFATSFVLVAAVVFHQLDISILTLQSSIWICQSFLGWYLIQLETYPLLTKSLTTAWIQFVGDFFAQAVEEFRIRNNSTTTSTQQQQPFSILRLQNYELRRGLSIAADGILLSGPLLHYVYDWMEENFPTEGSALAAGFHVLVNDICIDTFYLFLSFVFVAIAEGHWKDLPTLFRKDFVDTVKAGWGSSMGFMPIEFISFRYLPVQFRPLSMNFVDIVWGAIISYTAHRSRRAEMKDHA